MLACRGMMVPELAVTDGRPPPTDLPRGEFVATTLDDGSIRIDQADPRVLVSAEVLGDLARCSGYFTATGQWLAELDLIGCTKPGSYGGAVLKIYGTNRTVVYRIVEYVPRVRGYIAEWPD